MSFYHFLTRQKHPHNKHGTCSFHTMHDKMIERLIIPSEMMWVEGSSLAPTHVVMGLRCLNGEDFCSGTSIFKSWIEGFAINYKTLDHTLINIPKSSWLNKALDSSYTVGEFQTLLFRYPYLHTCSNIVTHSTVVPPFLGCPIPRTRGKILSTSDRRKSAQVADLPVSC